MQRIKILTRVVTQTTPEDIKKVQAHFKQNIIVNNSGGISYEIEGEARLAMFFINTLGLAGIGTHIDEIHDVK
jgi:hypothetical protein